MSLRVCRERVLTYEDGKHAGYKVARKLQSSFRADINCRYLTFFQRCELTPGRVLSSNRYASVLHPGEQSYVLFGIHVFDCENEAWRFISHAHAAFTQDDLVLLRVGCCETDFVAAGRFKYHERNYEIACASSSVWMKVFVECEIPRP